MLSWLGCRDSNPDTTVQSRMSYHWTTPQKDPKRGRDYTNKPTTVNRTEDSVIFNSQFSILNSQSYVSG